MTPKAKVLDVYPDAFVFTHDSGYIEIISGKDEDNYSLGGGDNVDDAWKDAADSIDEIDDMGLLNEL